MALFHDLAQLAESLAEEPGRLKKRAAIAAAIAHTAAPSPEPARPATARPTPASLADAGRFALYLAGQPFPEADPRKLSAGGALLTRALKQLSGCTDAAFTAAYRRHGDLGAAAFDLLAVPFGDAPFGHAPSTPTLTLEDLSLAFDRMASARSTAARFAAVESLLRRATPLEAKFLLKLMLGDMRIGVKQSLIEEAIAVAAATDAAAPVTAAQVTAEQVRHAVMLEADLARAVVRAFEHTLGEARMTLFHPLGFMLASPVDTPEEAIARFTPKPPKPEPAKPKPGKQTRRKSSAPQPEAEEQEEDFADLPPAEALEPAPRATISPTPEPWALGPGPSPEQAETPPPPHAIHAFLEDKYDGMRAQLHAGDPAHPGRVALYSRNREDITTSFPELAEAFSHAPVPLILDGEILGWDFATNQALPFATLAQRIGRKRVDEVLRRQIPVIFMAFDLLFENGDLLLPLPLRERRTRLEALAATLAPLALAPLHNPLQAHQPTLFDTAPNLPLETGNSKLATVPPTPSALDPGPWALDPGLSRFHLSPSTLVDSAAAIDRAYADARARANEGIMLKAASSAYLPGRRGLAWLKLKRELASLDAVITAAEFGHGRRAGLLSDYTFAVRGPTGPHGEPPELLNVGKAYSGLTDAEILDLTAWLHAHTLEDRGHSRTVEPLRVLEVAFNNIMRSTRHASGFALRFPRILRLRDDKPVAEIDTLARVEEIYLSQPDRPSEP